VLIRKFNKITNNMAEKFVGQVQFNNSQGESVFTIDPDSNLLQVGGGGIDGAIRVVKGDGSREIVIGDANGNVHMPNDCTAGRYFAGGGGADGSIHVVRADGSREIIIGDANGNVHMPNDCTAGRYFAGGGGTDGSIHVVRADGSREIIIGDANGNVHMPNDCRASRYLTGGSGIVGTIRVFNGDGSRQIIIGDDNANVTMPNDCIAKRFFADDVFLSGADCAEQFDVADADTLEPGTVMVINSDGRLEQSAQEYDKKVAGVISGAGKHKTGIVLDRQESEVNRRAVALMGKVYCKVDADNAPIEVGDLLTTSSTRGHAMKAADPVRALGTLIGKALHRLASGQGIIPILVALQ
jgi:hypothetical protein